ncbi:NUXM, NADH-ubiquinone oxidoreductase 21 kDa subunit [Agaricus bisporus var. burnettii JB137-S8]|uniref:NUXM, NADH-ubiquinone oxidoreductase 21 kDa subunit n=1 Tax=Agaricus bisporus var. burnettii (strain JB137-S8 / ATCC MYA-4627 / FGSC 10392) TaxID=597362 RepID=K5XF33_AGABU|nr:NUXM, NADH-ubiquinone oxidoreductase 21 kDa subunit [Agaricus bisporus var. burnettii JB137-S8]EKM81822.1 NUXM, NADH-ubiquinone oxidoreductase 21 kDa subunit [Agaricus bisporus var. burnettii JB137-S8]
MSTEQPYPLIDADPHAARVVRYFRPSDYAFWAGATAAFPAALYCWEMADPTKARLRTPLRLGGLLGFIGGFMMAYQRSSTRFWGWSENKREYDRDLEELSERARKGKPLYGESHQPGWVQGAAFRNSQWSQLKFSAFPMFNFVNHPHHGTDPEKYGVKKEDEGSQ